MINDFVNIETTYFDHQVKNIKADNDIEFQPLPGRFPDINFYLQDSPFANHNKQVDAVIRTLRNALGPNTNHLWDGTHDDIIKQLVKYYNNTYHTAINTSPLEMHQDIDKEWEYIREMTELLNDIKQQQHIDGLSRFTYGTRLMVHLNLGKTTAKHMKQRRTFNYLAEFKGYHNGNAIVELIPHLAAGKTIYDIIEVPLYHCVKVDKYTQAQQDMTFFVDEDIRRDFLMQRKLGATSSLRFRRYK